MKFDGFVGRSYVAQSPNVDCEETINLFLDEVESGKGKNQFTFYKAPGLKFFWAAPNGGPIRGVLPLNQLPNSQLGGVDGVWVAAGAYVYLIDGNANILATRGPIPNDNGSVHMAASPSQLALVTTGLLYWIDGVAPFLHGPVTWMGANVQLGRIGYIDQYFVLLDLPTAAGVFNGFWYSNPGDVSTGNSLNYITAEANANRYISLHVDREQIWLFGSLTTQAFYDQSSVNPNNPFAPNFSAVLPVGIVGPGGALTLSRKLCWLGASATSSAVAWTNDGGFVERRISNHAVEYQWSTYPMVSDVQAWGFTIKGHPIARFNFPSADVTWEYDFAMDDWRKVLQWDSIAGKYHMHQAWKSCAAFGKILVGDRINGNLYTTSLDYLDDNGQRNRWLRRSPIAANELKRVSFPWFELDIQPGVGDGSNADITQGPVTPEADPQIMMRMSKDWAQTWGPERQRSMGKLGETTKRTIWGRCGTGRNTVFECSGSASVKTVMNNAYLRDPILRKT